MISRNQPVISASCTSLFEAGAADIKQNLSNEASVLILERCVVSCGQQGVNKELFLWRKTKKTPRQNKSPFLFEPQKNAAERDAGSKLPPIKLPTGLPLSVTL